MTVEARVLRMTSAARKPPKAVADGAVGMALATVEVAAPPERAFAALLSNEVEEWRLLPGAYRLRGWQAELRPQGPWSVTVEFCDGRRFDEWGEICAVAAPTSIVMTRHSANPLVGDRQTTLAFRFEPSPHGTLITLREDGFLGRPQAAHAAAESWEMTLGWLDRYLADGLGSD